MREGARVVVDLERPVNRRCQCVRRRADANGGGGRVARLQLLARHLEAVVFQGVFRRANLLPLLPAPHQPAPLAPLESDIRLLRQFVRALGVIGDDELVGLVGVREEVVDPFLFHQPAGEGEVRFAILDAVVVRRVLAAELEGDVEALKHLGEDLRHALLLEDPRLHVLRQQPDLRDQLQTIRNEVLIRFAFFDGPDDAVNLPRRRAGLTNGDRGGSPEQVGKRHFLAEAQPGRRAGTRIARIPPRALPALRGEARPSRAAWSTESRGLPGCTSPRCYPFENVPGSVRKRDCGVSNGQNQAAECRSRRWNYPGRWTMMGTSELER